MNDLEYIMILNQERYPGFTTEWTVSGIDLTITLPLTNNGTYLCRVDWGDGAVSLITAYNSGNSHTYASAGTYNVEIIGDCPGWSFNNSGDKLKCTNIIHWGNKNRFNGFIYLTGGFYGCSNLSSMGEEGKIIPYQDDLVDVQDCFRGTGITKVTTGIFDLCVDLADNAFKATFKDCVYCTTIEPGVFDNNNLVANSAFYETFAGDILIEEIPTGLFQYNDLVADYGFYKTFDACQSLISIPSGLFDNNTLVADYGFYGTFGRCINIQSIPDELFDYNGNVGYQGFNQTFINDNRIETVPEGLFRLNTLVTDGFNQTFYGCSKAQFNQWIFYDTGEETTRFENIDSDFTECFYRESFTGTQGAAPNLWQCEFGGGQLTRDYCFAGAGNSLSSLVNYNDIPGDWIT